VSKTVKGLDLIRFTNGVAFPLSALRLMLPDVETALFFGKVYKLDARDLGTLLSTLFSTDIVSALTGEGYDHSMELQDYVVELGYEYLIQDGQVTLTADETHAEILPDLWDSFRVEIADSIQKVADTLSQVIGKMPGKQGEMLFKSMMTMNAKRPIVGDYRASIHHQRQGQNLVILDVSGSMTQRTVERIIEDVVALSWQADACLAIVSNTATVWAPGEFSVEAVLNAAEFGGTHYETLAQLMDQEWSVVVTIADYDSSRNAKEALAKCNGSIDTVLDISLVPQPTYLAECVGQLAREVRPLLIAAPHTTLMHDR
jgi:hypothetical protein